MEPPESELTELAPPEILSLTEMLPELAGEFSPGVMSLIPVPDVTVGWDTARGMELLAAASASGCGLARSGDGVPLKDTSE